MGKHFSIETLGELKLPLADFNDIANNRLSPPKSRYAEPAISKRLFAGARIYLSQESYALFTNTKPTDKEKAQIACFKNNFKLTGNNCLNVISLLKGCKFVML